MSNSVGVEKDIQIVCEALLEEYQAYDEGDNSPRGWYCHFCCEGYGYNSDRNNIKHALDCPVLVAKDLMTGMEVNHE